MNIIIEVMAIAAFYGSLLTLAVVCLLAVYNYILDWKEGVFTFVVECEEDSTNEVH